MNKEIRIIKGNELEEILDNYDSNYFVINLYYEFCGVDNDLWEFKAIIHNLIEDKYFSVNWFNNYSCNWNELGLDEEDFELTEVFPKQKLITVYE